MTPPRLVMDRRGFVRGLGMIGLGGGAASLLTSCANRGLSESVGQKLVLRQALEMGNIDPAYASGRSDDEIMNGIYEGLVAYRPGTTEQVNLLAEVFEPNEDGTLIRFRLKDGIPFHAGYGQVTAEDVKFSYERIAGVGGHKKDSPYAGDWTGLDEVRVTGKLTGEIVMKRPFAPLFKTTLPMARGYVISKRAFEERGPDFATQPIGTGPYEFVVWRPRQYARMRRFEDYGGANRDFAEPAEFKEIELVAVTNDNSAAIGLTTGDIDFGVISPIDAKRLRTGGLQVLDRPSVDYSFIGMNVKHPSLQDIRVRQAIREAVDVDSIVAAAFDDAYERATAIIPPNMGFGYWEDAPRRTADPDKARDLLQQAGVRDLELAIATANDQEAGDVVCQIVQSNLRDVGIRCRVDMQDGGAFFTLGGKVQAQRELFYTGFSSLPDPYWSTTWFTCDQIEQWNFQNWCDKKFGQLNEAATKTVETKARSAYYIRAQELWDEACNTIWVTWPTIWYAGSGRVEPSIRADGRMLPWNFRRAGA